MLKDLFGVSRWIQHFHNIHESSSRASQRTSYRSGEQQLEKDRCSRITSDVRLISTVVGSGAIIRIGIRLRRRQCVSTGFPLAPAPGFCVDVVLRKDMLSLGLCTYALEPLDRSYWGMDVRLWA